MDTITRSFFEKQLEEATALAAASDLVRVQAIAGPQFVVAEFRCRGLVRTGAGLIEEADRFDVGFRFASDYQRRVRPPELITWIGPAEVWHPNIAGPRFPSAICIGTITPSTPLVDLLYRVYEMITWQSYTPVEYDALNHEACAWARANTCRFPIDPRPLRWRAAGSDASAPSAATVAGSLLDAMQVVVVG